MVMVGSLGGFSSMPLERRAWFLLGLRLSEPREERGEDPLSIILLVQDDAEDELLGMGALARGCRCGGGLCSRSRKRREGCSRGT